MESAVSFGLNRPDTLVAQQTKYQCPSGNCTWDTFQSLAVCSACNDLTHRLTRGDFRLNNTDCRGIPYTCNGTEYRLPNGLTLKNLDGYRAAVLLTDFGTDNESYSISFGSKDTLIWSMPMIRIVDPEALWPSSPVTAAECGLWYCVKSYSSMVKDGSLIELSSPAPSERSRSPWQESDTEVRLHYRVPV